MKIWILHTDFLKNTKHWVLGNNMSECWHGVIVMIQCLRHTDRSAEGGQTRTPGCWCLLLTDIDFFWSKALRGCVGDCHVLLVDMSGIFRALRCHTATPSTSNKLWRLNKSWWRKGSYHRLYPPPHPLSLRATARLHVLISFRANGMHALTHSWIFYSQLPASFPPSSYPCSCFLWLYN